jgi:hypothetical protein
MTTNTPTITTKTHQVFEIEMDLLGKEKLYLCQ